jgi:PRMT5 TIM barrel domain
MAGSELHARIPTHRTPSRYPRPLRLRSYSKAPQPRRCQGSPGQLAALTRCQRVLHCVVQVSGVAQPAGFDFVATPIARSSARRPASAHQAGHDSFARADMVGLDSHWAGKVVGVTSSWIDPDSDDSGFRTESRVGLSAELDFARFCGLQAVILPAPCPERCECSNFARVRASRCTALHSYGLRI